MIVGRRCNMIVGKVCTFLMTAENVMAAVCDAGQVVR